VRYLLTVQSIRPDGKKRQPVGQVIAMSEAAREAMKKRPPDRGGNSRGTVKTGPGRGPRGPSRDQLQRIQEMLAGKADRGGRNPGTCQDFPVQTGADRLLATWINLGTLLRTLTPKVARICQDFPAVVC
jgi:hypothetical protein